MTCNIGKASNRNFGNSRILSIQIHLLGLLPTLPLLTCACDVTGLLDSQHLRGGGFKKFPQIPSLTNSRYIWLLTWSSAFQITRTSDFQVPPPCGHYFHRTLGNSRLGLSPLLIALRTLWINCSYLLGNLAFNASYCLFITARVSRHNR